MDQIHPSIATFKNNGNNFFSFDSYVVDTLDIRVYGKGYNLCMSGYAFTILEDGKRVCELIPVPKILKKPINGSMLFYRYILSLVMILIIF